MKLWHLLIAVFLLAIVMGIAREEVGRVAIIVFATGLGEVVLGTSSLLLLFRTFAALGMAQTIGAHLEAIAATAVVLVFGGGSMLAVLWCGASLVQMVVK